MAVRRGCGMVLVACLLGAGIRAEAKGGRIDADGVRDALLQGVERVHGGDQPGRMVVFAPSACAVAVYEGGAGEGPFVAAALWGKGRVVALPDHQALSMDAFGAQGDTGRFDENALAWLAPGKGWVDPSLRTRGRSAAFPLGVGGMRSPGRRASQRRG